MLLKIKKILFIIFNLRFYKAYLNYVFPLVEILDLFNKLPRIDNCIDVGSNRGQFAIVFKKKFPNARLYSFEPQIKNLQIQKKFLKNTRFFNYCLGNKSGKQMFNVTKRDDSSSLLEPLIFKNSIYKVVDKFFTKIKKLDNTIKLNKKKKNLLKLDVQGYELEVLKGSIKNLSKIDFIIIEICSKKNYLNQPNKNKIISFLNKNNFNIMKISNKTNLTNFWQTNFSLKNKQMVRWQADYLFKNKKRVK